MILTGLARLGRDAELRTAGSGDSVTNLSLAYNYGRKGQDGNRPTQWVEASLWGKMAEALAPYLKKGGLVDVIVEDVHMEQYEGRNGTGWNLTGRVMKIELAGSRSDGGDSSGSTTRQQSAPASQPRQSPPPAPKNAGSGGFDDDIPF